VILNCVIIWFGVAGIGDNLWWVYHPGICPGHSGPLSPLVGEMCTRDGFCRLWEETAPLNLRPYGPFINQFKHKIKIKSLISCSDTSRLLGRRVMCCIV